MIKYKGEDFRKLSFFKGTTLRVDYEVDKVLIKIKYIDNDIVKIKSWASIDAYRLLSREQQIDCGVAL